MPLLKKITAFLLLLSLLVTIAGYHALFRMQVGMARMEMKKQLRQLRNHEALVAIRLDQKNLHWENEGEFLMDGQMYDVVDHFKAADGTEWVRCISDKGETALLHQYRKAVQHNTESSLLSFLQLSTTLFTMPSGLKVEAPNQAHHRLYPDFHAAIPSRVRELTSPPPRWS